MTATNIDDKIKQENVLSGALKSLFAVSESYPELKANENFNKLQDQLQRLEEETAGSRRYYNGVVNRYNTKTELFPGNIIAGIFGFKRKPLFEVSNESERENVYGGHLTEAVISGTGELVLTEIEGTVDRKFDEEIGLNLFEF